MIKISYRLQSGENIENGDFQNQEINELKFKRIKKSSLKRVLLVYCCFLKRARGCTTVFDGIG